MDNIVGYPSEPTVVESEICPTSESANQAGFVPGRNRAASPYRFELEIDPEVWFLEDDGYELAVFHSHPSSPPRPSRTDVEAIGLWEGKPYVILSLRSGELAAWTIVDDSVNGLELS